MSVTLSIYVWCIVTSMLLKVGWRHVLADEQEYRLIRYLMSNYDPAVRPSVNASFPLKVVFSLSLQQIVDVDEENQVLTTNCWLTEKWNDVHLRWNASDFGGITVVRIPADQVWKPDIVLHNNADVQSTLPAVHANVILHSSGDIIWLSRGVYRSTCDMNIEFFPFDVQTCFLKFASWTHDVYQLELSMEKNEADITGFHPNGEFELDAFSSKLEYERFSCCDEMYHLLIYTISLRRRPLYFVLNLILPCFVINLVSVFSFYVPCSSGEKITLSVGSFVSLIFILTASRGSLPHSQTIPLISIYYGITLSLVACATVFSVFTLSIHSRGMRGTQVPVCIKKLMLGCLAKVLFLSFAPHRKDEHKLKKSSSLDVVKESKVGLDKIEHYTVSPRLRHRSETPVAIGPAAAAAGDTHRQQSRPLHGEEQFFERRFLRILHEVHETIERNERRVSEQESKETMKAEWEQVATVCDRFLLVMFLLAAFVSAFLILYTAATE